MKNRGRKQKLPGAIIRKLKSERGATLSMALLLFMVCAVVGGVILAAATASGGRLSQLAEMDQRYYSVTSAAKLLGEELSGKTVTIERTETTTTPYEKKEENGRIVIVQGSPVTRYAVACLPSDSDIIVSGAPGIYSWLRGLATHLMFGENVIPTGDDLNAEIMNYSFSYGKAGSFAYKDLHLDMSDGKPAGAALKVQGKVDMDSDGTLIITLCNESSLEDDEEEFSLKPDQYTVVLTMAPNTWDSESSSSYTDSNSRVDTRKITSEISWSVDSIR